LLIVHSYPQSFACIIDLSCIDLRVLDLVFEWLWLVSATFCSIDEVWR